MRLNQAKGNRVNLTVGFESAFGTAASATAGKLLQFNSSSITPSRELNQSATIVPGRSAVEPFQGNGDVSGDMVVPLDLNQMHLILKAAMGTPTTATPADAKGLTAVANNGSTVAGTVKITVATGHGVVAGDYFAVYGTTNYNGEHKALTATATEITFAHAYTAETPSGAYVSKTGFVHTFVLPDEQPSLSIEQAHVDIAEDFLFKGCKVSRMSISASSDGGERTVSVSIVGSKPDASEAPIAVASFASGGASATTVTTAAAHGLAVGDDVIIAGSVNYNGRWSVASAASTTTFTINKAYVAETVSTDPPVTQKCHFKAPATIPLKRLGTFSAKFYKDGAEYQCAQDVTIDIDMDLDGEQRCLGDNGFRSQLLEGIAAITASLTVSFRNGTFFRDGQNNTTAALKLEFTAAYGIGKLTIDMPKNKVQMAGVPVESPRGITQSVNAIAYTENPGVDGAVTITLTNAYQSI